MFGSLGAPELIIIAVVIILIFGVGKLSGLGKDLGSSIKEFRKAVKDEDEQKPNQMQAPQQQPPQPYVAPQAPQYQPPQPPPQYAAPVVPPPQAQAQAQGDQKNIF